MEQKNIILTGIERSGSSYCVDVLNNYSNVVFLNEPSLDYLTHYPERIIEYIGKYRHKILNNKPIKNIFFKGTNNITHDTIRTTRGVSKSRQYIGKYADKNFIFGFKALTPMLRLVYKIKYISSIRFLAIVRNPIDTIVSQMETSGSFLPNLPDSSPGVKNIIRQIQETNDVFIKACLIWRFNASIILDNKDIFTVIRYKSLCKNPTLVAKIALADMNIGTKLKHIGPSKIVKHRDKLNLKAITAIKHICGPHAEQLGVWK